MQTSGLELLANKRTSFQSTPDDSHYPSEKLVKDSLDSKASSTHLHPHSDITGLGSAATKDSPTSGNATTTQVVLGNDTRLNDTRTPVAHASSHTAGGTDPLQNLVITPTAANQKPLIVKGASGQSTSFLEIQGSDGTLVAGVNASGIVLAPFLSAVANTGPYVSMPGTTVAVTNRTTVGNVPLKVGGMASQTGDLQQWVDSSAIVLASVTKDGYLTGTTPPAADLTTKQATTAWAAERATIGNLLTANQASGTDTLGDTTGFLPLLSTVASVTGGISGKCLEVTATSVNIGGSVSLSNRADGTGIGAPVIAGQVYTAVMSIKSATSTTGRLRILWLNSAGGVVTTIDGNDVPLGGAWGQSSITAVAPVGAVTAGLYFRRGTATIGDVHLLDNIGLWAGAGGDWAMPGTPITNLGTKVTHPNIDDVLVQRWDSGLGRWQTVHYDSGWRQMSGSLLNGWITHATWPEGCRIRRVNSTIYVKLGLDGRSSTSSTVLTLPVGFRAHSLNIAILPMCDSSNPSAMPTVGLYVQSNLVSSIGSRLTVLGYWGNDSFITVDDAIPTSLPGTLVSAAPA